MDTEDDNDDGFWTVMAEFNKSTALLDFLLAWISAQDLRDWRRSNEIQ